MGKQPWPVVTEGPTIRQDIASSVQIVFAASIALIALLDL
jgi:hypothetical protein